MTSTAPDTTAAATLIRSALGKLDHVVKLFALRPDNPEARRLTTELYYELIHLCSGKGALPFDLDKIGLRHGMEPVLAADAAPWVFNLWAAGFRRIEFLPGLEESELRWFIELISDEEAPDLAWRAWARNLIQIRFQLAPMPALSKEMEPEVSRLSKLLETAVPPAPNTPRIETWSGDPGKDFVAPDPKLRHGIVRELQSESIPQLGQRLLHRLVQLFRNLSPEARKPYVEDLGWVLWHFAQQGELRGSGRLLRELQEFCRAAGLASFGEEAPQRVPVVPAFEAAPARPAAQPESPVQAPAAAAAPVRAKKPVDLDSETLSLPAVNAPTPELELMDTGASSQTAIDLDSLETRILEPEESIPELEVAIETTAPPAKPAADDLSDESNPDLILPELESPFEPIPPAPQPPIQAQSRPVERQPVVEPKPIAPIVRPVIGPVKPVAEQKPAVEPRAAARPAVESRPAAPKSPLETRPVVETRPSAEIPPAGETRPAAEIQPAPSVKPLAESKPGFEFKLAPESIPRPEVKPTFESIPAVELMQTTELKPTFEQKPAAEKKPSAEKRPAPAVIQSEFGPVRTSAAPKPRQPEPPHPFEDMTPAPSAPPLRPMQTSPAQPEVVSKPVDPEAETELDLFRKTEAAPKDVEAMLRRAEMSALPMAHGLHEDEDPLARDPEDFEDSSEFRAYKGIKFTVSKPNEANKPSEVKPATAPSKERRGDSAFWKVDTDSQGEDVIDTLFSEVFGDDEEPPPSPPPVKKPVVDPLAAFEPEMGVEESSIDLSALGFDPALLLKKPASKSPAPAAGPVPVSAGATASRPDHPQDAPDRPEMLWSDLEMNSGTEAMKTVPTFSLPDEAPQGRKGNRRDEGQQAETQKLSLAEVAAAAAAARIPYGPTLGEPRKSASPASPLKPGLPESDAVLKARALRAEGKMVDARHLLHRHLKDVPEDRLADEEFRRIQQELRTACMTQLKNEDWIPQLQMVPGSAQHQALLQAPAGGVLRRVNGVASLREIRTQLQLSSQELERQMCSLMEWGFVTLLPRRR